MRKRVEEFYLILYLHYLLSQPENCRCQFTKVITSIVTDELSGKKYSLMFGPSAYKEIVDKAASRAEREKENYYGE